MDQPLLGFDIESTGVDIETARIVTACAVRWGGGLPLRSRSWLSDVGGEPIPAEATEIHGITTAAALSEGRPARDVVQEIVTVLAAGVLAGSPLVIMNAPFDLSLLDRECERYGVHSLFELCEPRVIDPRVLDKRVEKYRKGGRKLSDLSRHYGVTLTAAHSADADAAAACEVAWQIGFKYPWIGQRHPDGLHTDQAKWARSQAEGLRDWFARFEDPETAAQAAGVRLDWPFIPRPREASGGPA
ncbi:exonuclease domain-containing protein [Streptomyces sp. NBC_01207]|uniref:exonuclease domain-containing protein n=1 Tax=Streptomyces sp. NBC_01207 TaxID=2903772 RepID=UPI002E0DB483